MQLKEVAESSCCRLAVVTVVTVVIWSGKIGPHRRGDWVLRKAGHFGERVPPLRRRKMRTTASSSWNWTARPRRIRTGTCPHG